MEEMNDKQLDDLIMESLRRDENLKVIEQRVMKTLQTEQKHAKSRKWATIVAYCIGLPLLLMFILYSAYFMAKTVDYIAVTASMAFFTLVFIIFCVKEINFSPKGV